MLEEAMMMTAVLPTENASDARMSDDDAVKLLHHPTTSAQQLQALVGLHIATQMCLAREQVERSFIALAATDDYQRILRSVSLAASYVKAEPVVPLHVDRLKETQSKSRYSKAKRKALSGKLSLLDERALTTEARELNQIIELAMREHAKLQRESQQHHDTHIRRVGESGTGEEAGVYEHNFAATLKSRRGHGLTLQTADLALGCRDSPKGRASPKSPLLSPSKGSGKRVAAGHWLPFTSRQQTDDEGDAQARVAARMGVSTEQGLPDGPVNTVHPPPQPTASERRRITNDLLLSLPMLRRQASHANSSSGGLTSQPSVRMHHMPLPKLGKTSYLPRSSSGGGDTVVKVEGGGHGQTPNVVATSSSMPRSSSAVHGRRRSRLVSSHIPIRGPSFAGYHTHRATVADTSLLRVTPTLPSTTLHKSHQHKGGGGTEKSHNNKGVASTHNAISEQVLRAGNMRAVRPGAIKRSKQ
eukprot:PhM_4_TR346/c0_g1_i1/m.25431